MGRSTRQPASLMKLVPGGRYVIPMALCKPVISFFSLMNEIVIRPGVVWAVYAFNLTQ